MRQGGRRDLSSELQAATSRAASGVVGVAKDQCFAASAKSSPATVEADKLQEQERWGSASNVWDLLFHGGEATRRTCNSRMPMEPNRGRRPS